MEGKLHQSCCSDVYLSSSPSNNSLIKHILQEGKWNSTRRYKSDHWMENPVFIKIIIFFFLIHSHKLTIIDKLRSPLSLLLQCNNLYITKHTFSYLSAWLRAEFVLESVTVPGSWLWSPFAYTSGVPVAAFELPLTFLCLRHQHAAVVWGVSGPEAQSCKLKREPWLQVSQRLDQLAGKHTPEVEASVSSA